jgi:putative multicomponent Na+:H+ antiporter subunit B
MIIDNYIYVIVALLPLSALILVIQQNPYQALVLRAILGAVAVLVYVVLGGADVALTEALVGTMLAITLYIIALRSSLAMHLGVVQEAKPDSYTTELLDKLEKVAKNYHLRLKITQYCDPAALKTALMSQEVHVICLKSDKSIADGMPYHTSVRVHRLFKIIETELAFPETKISFVPSSNMEEKH